MPLRRLFQLSILLTYLCTSLYKQGEPHLPWTILVPTYPSCLSNSRKRRNPETRHLGYAEVVQTWCDLRTLIYRAEAYTFAGMHGPNTRTLTLTEAKWLYVDALLKVILLTQGQLACVLLQISLRFCEGTPRPDCG